MTTFALLLLAGCPDPKTDTGEVSDSGETTETGESGETGETGETGEVTLDPDFEASQDVVGGCGDMILYARDETDTVGLVLTTTALALAEAACAAGEAQTSILYLEYDAVVELHVDVGEHVTHLVCGDVVEYEPVIDGTWSATAGTATFVVTPQESCGADPYAMVALTLADVTLTPDDGGDDVTIEALSFEAFVGWMPG